jgi:hypothetical protein
MPNAAGRLVYEARKASWLLCLRDGEMLPLPLALFAPRDHRECLGFTGDARNCENHLATPRLATRLTRRLTSAPACRRPAVTGSQIEARSTRTSVSVVTTEQQLPSRDTDLDAQVPRLQGSHVSQAPSGGIDNSNSQGVEERPIARPVGMPALDGCS